MNPIFHKFRRNDSGYSLMMTLAVVAVCAIMLAGLLEYAGSEVIQARRENDSTKAFLIAQAGMEAAKAAVVSTNGLVSAKNSFAKYYVYNDPATTLDETQGPNKFDFFSKKSSMTSHSISYNGFTVSFPNNVDFQGGTYDVTVVEKRGHSDDMNSLYAIGDLKLISVGTYNGTRRTIHETIRFKQAASRIFDYAYFINNLGWHYGHTIQIDGDVRSNGNFNYKHGPTINGYTIAAKANGTEGVVKGDSRADRLEKYYTDKSDRSRPGNPADPKKPTTSKYSSGYDGVAYVSPDSAHREHQDPLTMPYIGTVDAYEQLASDKTGYVEYWDSSLNKYTRLDQSFGDETTVGVVAKGAYAKFFSPAGNKGKAMYIAGDASHPIKLHGPFVVQGDLVIKGVYTGQGTIVARRNVHIIGNLTAKDPPIYPATDSTPYSTYATNRNKDMIGLVARGNVIFGNYTGSPDFLDYATPPFTSKYIVDPKDEDNGYVSFKSGSDSFFNGNYDAIDKNFDGTTGTKSDGVTSRKYYESTFSDVDLKGLFVDRREMTRIDGVLYCNHLIGGSVGDITFNGTVVGRDEGIVFMGHARFRYDERIHSSHGENVLDIFLPKDLALPIRLAWHEGN